MKPLIPVLVCGSRTFDHSALLPYVMQDLLPIVHEIEIIEGGAQGADAAAYRWAKFLGIPVKEFTADWDVYGKAAGPFRNDEMAGYCSVQMDKYKLPGYCFAFWDGSSRGTKDMFTKAEDAGLITTVHEYLPRELYFPQLLREWQDRFNAACGKKNPLQ